MNQNITEPVVAPETLAEVPEHVLRGLPEEVRLFPSAVDKTRIVLVLFSRCLGH